MTIKGYNVPYGYMGYVSEYDEYMLFASDTEYKEYIAQ